MTEPTFSWLVAGPYEPYCNDGYCPCRKPLPGRNPSGREYIVVEAEEVVQ